VLAGQNEEKSSMKYDIRLTIQGVQLIGGQNGVWQTSLVNFSWQNVG
jgi:hypothetical protein